jgi:hypothetical protein
MASGWRRHRSHRQLHQHNRLVIPLVETYGRKHFSIPSEHDTGLLKYTDRGCRKKAMPFTPANSVSKGKVYQATVVTLSFKTPTYLAATFTSVPTYELGLTALICILLGV